MRFTESEYQKILDRQKATEKELHGQIIRECMVRGWLAFHGSMAHRTKRTAGEPDFIILANVGRVLLVECKSKIGKLTIDQAATIAWAEKLGHTIHVVRSIEDFQSVIRDMI